MRIRAWKPETVFITHFGPYGNVPEHLDDLERSLTAAADVVKRILQTDVPDEAKYEQFKKAVFEYIHAAGIPDLGFAQPVAIALLVAGAVACYFVPARKTPFQLAALSAALLIGFELTQTHWFYLYIPWFFPFVAFVVLAPRRRRPEPHDDPEREPVAAG